MTERVPSIQASSSNQVGWGPVGSMVKRLFDFMASLIGLVLLSPFFLLIGILIRRDSPGPIFYRGPRLGRGGKPFKILKFRTMYECNETYQGPPITASDDDRITPLGRWLRDTKLNELPQLWNVLVGEMSLVGPRPEAPEVAATWSQEDFNEVLSLRPGVTSPASVLYRNEESLLRADQVMAAYLDTILPSKVRLDQLYVRNHSFWLDLDIIFWTLIVLLPRLGKVSPLEESLFWGPVSRLSKRYLDWFMIDTLVTFVALGVVGVLWRSFGPLDIGWPNAIITGVGFSLLFSLAGVLMGVNRITWSRALANDAFDLLPPVLLATVVALAGNYFFEPHRLPSGMILGAAGLAFMGFVTIRYRSRLLTGFATRWLAWRGGGARAALERALIVGGGETGQFAAWLLSNNGNASLYRVVGFVDDDLYKQGARIRGVNVLGKRSNIPQLVAKHDIGVIFFAIHNISAKERQEVLDICASTPARVAIVPDILKAVWSIAVPDDPAAGGNGKNKGGVDSTKPAAQAFPERNGILPCDLCIMKVSPLKVDAWMVELDETAQSGDLEALRLKIRQLQDQLRPDVLKQKQANLVSKED